MDSFEFNKIAGAVLGTALGVMALSIVSDIIYEPGELTGPSYVIAVADTEESEVAGGGGGGEEPIAARLAAADIAAGERSARKCQACHTFEQGGPAKVGPNLFGVVGGPAGHMDGFKYSDALLAEAQSGLTWDFETLDHYLVAPKDMIPGTAMAFAGLKRPDERADVIAYLNSLSDDPMPYPPPPDSAAAEGEAGADSADDGGEAAGASESTDESSQDTEEPASDTAP